MHEGTSDHLPGELIEAADDLWQILFLICVLHASTSYPQCSNVRGCIDVQQQNA